MSGKYLTIIDKEKYTKIKRADFPPFVNGKGVENQSFFIVVYKCFWLIRTLTNERSKCII